MRDTCVEGSTVEVYTRTLCIRHKAYKSRLYFDTAAFYKAIYNFEQFDVGLPQELLDCDWILCFLSRVNILSLFLEWLGQAHMWSRSSFVWPQLHEASWTRPILARNEAILWCPALALLIHTAMCLDIFWLWN